MLIHTSGVLLLTFILRKSLPILLGPSQNVTYRSLNWEECLSSLLAPRTVSSFISGNITFVIGLSSTIYGPFIQGEGQVF